MEKFSKFIIQSDSLIMAKVTYHKELVIDHTSVKGGGWFVYNHDNKSFTFHGESHDYGKASIENIKKCVEEKKVYTDIHLHRNVSNQYTFFCINEDGQTIQLNNRPLTDNERIKKLDEVLNTAERVEFFKINPSFHNSIEAMIRGADPVDLILHFVKDQIKQDEVNLKIIQNRPQKIALTIDSDLFKEQVSKEVEAFCNWKDDTGWIRRPFPEESGIYLYDDFKINSDDFNYNSGKTLQQVKQIYYKSIKK